MARKHAILSASGAHRWLNCTPSARLEEPLPDTSSIFAEEGTLAHDLAELELSRALKRIKAKEYNARLKEIKANELYSDEMLGYVNQFTDYAMEQFREAQAKESSAEIFLEQRVDFSPWVPEGFGTSDCTIIGGGLMEIIDFKYGKGVEVEAEDNTQMMLYALGALNAFDFIYDVETVRMTVHQPRIDNVSSSGMSEWDLRVWAEGVLRPKALMAWDGKGEATPGDWCRFCKVKDRCKARAVAVQTVPSAFDYKDPNLLEIKEVAELLHTVDLIEAWAKDLKNFALVQARDHGVKFAGWKLVEGRSNRKYVDEDKVAKALTKAKYKKIDIYKAPELLGITAMERLLGKKRFAELLEANGLVEKPEGKPVLVAESDSRPEINSAAADFDL